ncbi:MAG: hypothetical protein M3Q56_01445 [Bacteroidota bacterium]|nr:hypothetical protein [Bacteroidota bacterium]
MNHNIVIFSIHRYMLLIKREIALAKKPFLYAIAGVIGGLSIPVLLQIFSRTGFNNFFTSQSLIISLTIMSIVWASISFAELIQSSSRQLYLSLPASTFEKLAAKWLTISIIIPIVFMIIYMMYAYGFTFFMNIISTKELAYPAYDFSQIFQAFLRIILVQSIFYAGSVWMPKYSLLKTSLAIVVFWFCFAIFALICVRIIYFDYFKGMHFVMDNVNMNFQLDALTDQTWLRVFGAILIGFYFMTLTFFKLKEKEL